MYKCFGRNGIVRANQLNEPINKHFKTLKTKFSGMRFHFWKPNEWGKHFKKMIWYVLTIDIL